jgi:hypothetical protein
LKLKRNPNQKLWKKKKIKRETTVWAVFGTVGPTHAGG